MPLSSKLTKRIKKIKLVIFDNDGVLTDGRIILGDRGDELKFFDVQDGHGLVMLRRAGLKVGASAIPEPGHAPARVVSR